jgi:hypothetical protein
LLDTGVPLLPGVPIAFFGCCAMSREKGSSHGISFRVERMSQQAHFGCRGSKSVAKQHSIWTSLPEEGRSLEVWISEWRGFGHG